MELNCSILTGTCLDRQVSGQTDIEQSVERLTSQFSNSMETIPGKKTWLILVNFVLLSKQPSACFYTAVNIQWT